MESSSPLPNSYGNSFPVVSTSHLWIRPWIHSTSILHSPVFWISIPLACLLLGIALGWISCLLMPPLQRFIQATLYTLFKISKRGHGSSLSANDHCEHSPIPFSGSHVVTPCTPRPRFSAPALSQLKEKRNHHTSKDHSSTQEKSTLRQIISWMASVDHHFIHKAVDYGDITYVQYILSCNVDINERDSEGQTPLHHAVLQQNSELVDLLLQACANANLQDHQGNRPLYLATLGGDLQCAEKLLCRGSAEVDLGNEDGNLPIWLSATLNDEPMTQMLIQYGALDKSPNLSVALMKALQNESWKVLRILLNYASTNASQDSLLSIDPQKILNKLQQSDYATCRRLLSPLYSIALPYLSGSKIDAWNETYQKE